MVAIVLIKGNVKGRLQISKHEEKFLTCFVRNKSHYLLGQLICFSIKIVAADLRGRI